MGLHGHCLPPRALGLSGELVSTALLLGSPEDGLVPTTEGYELGEVVQRDRPTVGPTVLGPGPGPGQGLAGAGGSSSSLALDGLSQQTTQSQSQSSKPEVKDAKDKKRGGPGKPRREDKEDEIRQKLLALPGADLPGFIPLREDFDVEYRCNHNHNHNHNHNPHLSRLPPRPPL